MVQAGRLPGQNVVTLGLREWTEILGGGSPFRELAKDGSHRSDMAIMDDGYENEPLGSDRRCIDLPRYVDENTVAAIVRIIRGSREGFTCCFAAVTEITAPAARLICEEARKCAAAGINVMFVNVSPVIKAVFHVLGLYAMAPMPSGFVELRMRQIGWRLCWLAQNVNVLSRSENRE